MKKENILQDIENMMFSIFYLELSKPLPYWLTENNRQVTIDRISINDVCWNSDDFGEPTLCASNTKSGENWVIISHIPEFKVDRHNDDTLKQIYKEVLSTWKKQFNHIINSQNYKNA